MRDDRLLNILGRASNVVEIAWSIPEQEPGSLLDTLLAAISALEEAIKPPEREPEPEIDWKLSPEQQDVASDVWDMLTAAFFVKYPLVSYKGLLDGREVIVMSIMVDGMPKAMALAITEEMFSEIAVERADGSVRKGG